MSPLSALPWLTRPGALRWEWKGGLTLRIAAVGTGEQYLQCSSAVAQGCSSSPWRSSGRRYGWREEFEFDSCRGSTDNGTCITLIFSEGPLYVSLFSQYAPNVSSSYLSMRSSFITCTKVQPGMERSRIQKFCFQETSLFIPRSLLATNWLSFGGLGHRAGAAGLFVNYTHFPWYNNVIIGTCGTLRPIGETHFRSLTLSLGESRNKSSLKVQLLTKWAVLSLDQILKAILWLKYLKYYYCLLKQIYSSNLTF